MKQIGNDNVANRKRCKVLLLPGTLYQLKFCFTRNLPLIVTFPHLPFLPIQPLPHASSLAKTQFFYFLIILKTKFCICRFNLSCSTLDIFPIYVPGTTTSTQTKGQCMIIALLAINIVGVYYKKHNDTFAWTKRENNSL